MKSLIKIEMPIIAQLGILKELCQAKWWSIHLNAQKEKDMVNENCTTCLNALFQVLTQWF